MKTGFDEHAITRKVLLEMLFDRLECALDQAAGTKLDLVSLASTLQESLALTASLAAVDRR